MFIFSRVVTGDTGKFQSVRSIGPNVELQVYPMFYPSGSGGWNINVLRNNSDKFQDQHI